MASKPSPDDIANLCRERNYVFLSSAYINAHTKYTWKCAQEHQWDATYNSVKRGSGCPVCAGNQALPDESLQTMAQMHGLKCLSTKYVSAHTKYEWECSSGHKWPASYNNIKKGHGCPTCKGGVRLQGNVLESLAHSRGFICHSANYVNAFTNYHWECGKAHRWWATYNSVQQGSGCARCSKFGPIPKIIQELENFAQQYGGHCLSTHYVDRHTHYEWECEAGHQWTTPAHSVINSQTWCPFCAVSGSPLERQLNATAKAWGGEYLGPKDGKTRKDEHYPFTCDTGHTFAATPREIAASVWCPHCKGLTVKRTRGVD